VTFEEALGELGITAAADAQTARRAYLKLIKVRKPETDPEGFQRARRAYERITAQLDRGEPQPVSTSVLAAPAGTEPTTIDGFRAELAAMPPGASVETPIAIARRAIAALPDEEEPVHWLLHALVDADRRDEAISALRASRSRFPALLLDLALRFPAVLTEDEVRDVAAKATPPML